MSRHVMGTTGWQEARLSPRKCANWPMYQLSGATHCNTLQHTATHCKALQHIATHCNTLQHTATHCNTLQHTATHCNTLQHTAYFATHCRTLQQTATHCNTLQHIAQHWSSSDPINDLCSPIILQNVILRTRSCGTGVITQPSWLLHFHRPKWSGGNILYHWGTSTKGHLGGTSP